LIDPSKIQVIYAGAAAACACLACVFDLRESRIPNWLTAPLLLAGLLAHTWSSHWRGLADAVVAALLAGVVFLLFHLAGGMGAGDVKLMAATAGMIGLSSVGTLLISTALAGGLFAIAVSLARGVFRETFANASALLTHHGTRGLVPHPEFNLTNPTTIRLPFAVPIAAGCLYTLGTAMVQQ
jgi:prepilin peptidase CpaA